MADYKEVKHLVLTRVGPGDRWVEDGTTYPVFESLIDGLEAMFQRTGNDQYRFSGRDGMVWAITSEELPPPPKKAFSIYGDES